MSARARAGGGHPQAARRHPQHPRRWNGPLRTTGRDAGFSTPVFDRSLAPTDGFRPNRSAHRERINRRRRRCWWTRSTHPLARRRRARCGTNGCCGSSGASCGLGWTSVAARRKAPRRADPSHYGWRNIYLDRFDREMHARNGVLSTRTTPSSCTANGRRSASRSAWTVGGPEGAGQPRAVASVRTAA